MSNKATVIVWHGQLSYHVTGKIYRIYPDGVSVDDERGVRHFAPNERVTIHYDNDNADNCGLW